MSDAKTPQQEPSMEEILASIRRIISEDGEAGKEPPAMPAAAPAAAAAPAPAPAKPAEKPADVLELTEMVSDDGKVTNINAPAAAAPPPPPPPPAPPPPPPAPEPPAAAAEPAEDLVSATTAAAAAGSLASLQAMAKEPERDYSPPRSLALGDGALTLEDIVREELRPILKSWLEENLPGMVERLVQKEIKRITRNVDGS